MALEGNPIYEASQRVQAFVDAHNRGMSPGVIQVLEGNPLLVSDLQLLIATAVYATRGEA